MARLTLLLFAPVERGGAAVPEPAGSVEAACLQRSRQVDRRGADAAGPGGIDADLRAAGSSHLAYHEHGHAGIAARPLAGDPALGDGALGTKAARRL